MECGKSKESMADTGLCVRDLQHDLTPELVLEERCHLKEGLVAEVMKTPQFVLIGRDGYFGRRDNLPGAFGRVRSGVRFRWVAVAFATSRCT